MIRSTSRISLEYVIFHSTLKDDKDIGRPLTFYPHLSNIESPLEEKRINENNYRGFINLLVIALVLSHLRLMYENYIKYGLLLTPGNAFKFVLQSNNLIFVSVSMSIIAFSVVLTFFIEKASSKSHSHIIYWGLHTLNMAFLLVAPVYLHKYDIINPSKNLDL